MSPVITCLYRPVEKGNLIDVYGTFESRSSLDDELCAYILHLDEKRVWTKYGKMIGQTSNSPELDTTINFSFQPSDTKVLTFNGQNTSHNHKDLFVDDADTAPGFTKLVPTSPVHWLNRTVKVGSKRFLKHLTWKREKEKPSYILAFRSEWPAQASEWLDRPRRHNWPQKETLKQIEIDSCRVLPSQSAVEDPLRIEWKFAFEKSEQILVSTLTCAQKSCFHILRPLVENVLSSKHFNYQNLRQVFFYVREEMDQNTWLVSPANALQTVVQRLQNCYKTRRLPNYFIAEHNMIENVRSETAIAIVDRLELLRKHMLIVLYFTLDDRNQIQFFLSPMLDGLIKDIQSYNRHPNIELSSQECFLTFAVDGLANLAKDKSFNKLFEKTNQVLFDLGSLAPTMVSLERLCMSVVKKVSPKSLQWLCAFFYDRKLGTFYTECVCSGEESVSLFQYFGPEIASCLHISPEGDIKIPTSITNVESLPGLAIDVLYILKGCVEIDETTYGKCLDFFLSRYRDFIVVAINDTNMSPYSKQLCESQLKILSSLLIISTHNELMESITHALEVKAEEDPSFPNLMALAGHYISQGRREDAKVLLGRTKDLIEKTRSCSDQVSKVQAK